MKCTWGDEERKDWDSIMWPEEESWLDGVLYALVLKLPFKSNMERKKTNWAKLSLPYLMTNLANGSLFFSWILTHEMDVVLGRMLVYGSLTR